MTRNNCGTVAGSHCNLIITEIGHCNLILTEIGHYNLFLQK